MLRQGDYRKMELRWQPKNKDICGRALAVFHNLVAVILPPVLARTVAVRTFSHVQYPTSKPRFRALWLITV